MNKRFKTKTLTLMIAVITVITCLASCGGEKNDGTTSLTTGASGVTSTSAGTTGSAGPDHGDDPAKNIVFDEFDPGDGNIFVMSFDLSVTGAGNASLFASHYVPDLFTVQKADKEDIAALSSSISGYAYFTSSDFNADGSANAIFFKTSKYDVLTSKVTGLAADPTDREIKGAGMVYALLYSASDGSCVALFNTALESGKEKDQIFYMYSKYSCYISYYPVIVTGAINAPEGSDEYRTLTEGGKLTFDQRVEGSVILSSSTEKVEAKALSADTVDFSVPAASLKAVKTNATLDGKKKLIALTFDDGPTSADGYTNKVLSILDEHNAKATFFVLGQQLTPSNPKQRALLKAAFENGHEIGNHTYGHTLHYHEFENDDKLNEDLAKADELIADITGGMKATLLRPPGGIVKRAVSTDRPIIDWSIDTNDWNSASYSPTDVYNTIIKKAENGSIVLMHDVKKNSPTMLSDLLDWLDANGFQCVTVSELMEFSGVSMIAGNIYLTNAETGRRTFG